MIDLTHLLTIFLQWAVDDSRIVAVSLVGSYARGEARPDSDVDLVVITDSPESFRDDTDWVGEIAWERAGLAVEGWDDRDYGALWSRHILLSSGLIVEAGFTSPDWAATDPADEGTMQVIRNGFRIILDPSGLLNRLAQSAGDR